MATRSRWFATAAAAALFTYTLIVLLPGLRLGPVVVRTWHAALAIMGGWIALAWLIGRVARRPRAAARLTDVGAACLSILISLLIADTALAIVRNLRAVDPSIANITYERESDPAIWHGELYPRIYYPTRLGYLLYKPNVSLRGMTYGEYYEHRMLASPLLRDSVLELRPVGYRINQHGLREDAALADARIYALGDSYVFGYATDEGSIWPAVLERAISEPVYNLGVSAAGPKQELQLLERMLTQHGDSMHIQHLLWMIFEGNDLENSYAERRPPPPNSPRLNGTALGTLADLPGQLRDQSIIHALASGGLSLSRRDRRRTEVDGIVLRNPLYHSDRWGYRLFNAADVRTATRDAAYVRRHRNAPAVAASVRAMKNLSQRHAFRVTVLLAPSDVRLYSDSFDGLPALADTPHFLDYFAQLAVEAGFGVVDLARLMKNPAERELLYYRDDHHWNARGNAVAAQLIAESVRF